MKLIHKLLLSIFIISVLYSCSPKMNADWSNSSYVKKPAKNVLVITMMKNLDARQSLENDIVSDLRKNHNYTYITGMELFPPNAAGSLDQSEIESKIVGSNVDLVIATSFVNAYQSQQYQPGPDMYVPYYYGVGARIYMSYDFMSTPGYYETTDNFVLVTSIYDTRVSSNLDSCLIWQGESTVYDPSSVNAGAADYADNLVSYLDKNNILP